MRTRLLISCMSQTCQWLSLCWGVPRKNLRVLRLTEYHPTQLEMQGLPPAPLWPGTLAFQSVSSPFSVPSERACLYPATLSAPPQPCSVVFIRPRDRSKLVTLCTPPPLPRGVSAQLNRQPPHSNPISQARHPENLEP